jgi:hypothetical protein
MPANVAGGGMNWSCSRLLRSGRANQEVGEAGGLLIDYLTLGLASQDCAVLRNRSPPINHPKAYPAASA